MECREFPVDKLLVLLYNFLVMNQVTAYLEILLNREVAEVYPALADIANAKLHQLMSPKLRDVLLLECYRARRYFRYVEDGFYNGGFPGSIRTYQRDDFIRLDIYVNPFQDLKI